MGLFMPNLIRVTPDNIDTVLTDLPRMARLALGFAARLRRGTLDVTLPDGRVIRLGGLEPGPAAAMTLANYGFAARLINGGDIGIAEAYLNGDWDTPDLTQFLYLFCVNHELIQAMLGDKVRVVSAFQNVGAHALKDVDHDVACDVLVCGDDVAAREVAIGLAADIGLAAWHAGPICNSAAAEALTSVLIAINMRYKSTGAGIRITGVPSPKKPE